MESISPMNPDLLNCFDDFKENEFKNIEKEINLNRNMPFAFLGLGEIGEELALYMFPKSYGSASKGGCAFDNKEIDRLGNVVLAREIKMCSLDGSKECVNKECKGTKNIGHKAPAFQEKCIYCKGSDFEVKTDSRCGISVKPHIEWAINKDILKEYVLISVKYDRGSESIYIHCWKVMCDNEYFKDYILNQSKYGKGGSCNCLPYSIDFHLSGPITLFEIELFKDCNKIHYYDLSNTVHDAIPKYNKNTGKQLQFQYTVSDDPFMENTSINYTENINKFKLKSGKNNCLGKVRGKTTRN
jgi:hypothetical protein